MTTTEPTGTARTDPFLTLDDTGRALRDELIAAARDRCSTAGKTHDFTTMGRMQNPRVGDLVLELTRASWSRDQRTRTIGFGYLIARHGETWWVQYGPDPDDVCSWDNAMFIRAD